MIGKLLADSMKFELGFLSKHQTLYRYVPYHDKAHQKIFERMTHWSLEKVKEQFPPKPDDNGNPYIIEYGASVRCPSEEMSKGYSKVKGIYRIPRSKCKNCKHKRGRKRGYYCELIREKYKGVTKEMWDEAVKTTKDLMGGTLR